MHYKGMHPTDAEDIQLVINYCVRDARILHLRLSSKLVTGSKMWSTEVLTQIVVEYVKDEQ